VQVTEKELQAQVAHQLEVQKSLLSGAAFPPLNAILWNADRAMTNLKLVQSSLSGSQAEREDMWRTMYTLRNQFGSPHFMLTLTPSGLSNGMVATIARGNDTEQVSSLFRDFTADLSDESTVERTRKIRN